MEFKLETLAGFLREFYQREDVHLFHIQDRAGYEVRVGLERFEVPYHPISNARTVEAVGQAMQGAKHLGSIPELGK